MRVPPAIRRQSRREVVTDLLLWLLLCAFVAAMGPDPVQDPAAFGTVTAPRLALASAAVLVGRSRPLAALVLLLPLGPWRFSEGFATVDLSWLLPRTGVKILPVAPTSPFIMWYAYLTGRREAGTWPPLAAFGLIAVVGVAVVLAAGGDLALWVSMVTGLVGTYLVPYLLGLVRRLVIRQRGQARLSAEAQARLRERARIARDMHDSLGHDLALIAVRAAGLELAPGLDPAQARAAGELREAAADATDRLRQIIGLLGEDAAAAPLAPVDEDVTELVRRARDSGMAIDLDMAAGPVPGLARAVVQEGLTNAAKHAPGAAVRVSVGPRRVSVRNGPARGRPRARRGGTGLTGLAERARLAGGTLTAGAVDGGYELVVELP
ncbi:Sensor histidine kinase LiaS [Nonomuraea coxensis DSM 45129]|uniref:histidine kinase n=1 Tax=Nonomuraea coxensis DSM 45129 TaxID=1122611 RepID=A0ABX8TW12_9ACTN|nr:histidine kinase [Nonomuraea coxensis]QYC39455.1 Sensor histidine kinase LiaS [Nonomuraea coxensis DSM 45129]